MEEKEFRSVWLLLLGFCCAAVAVLALCVLSRARLPDTVGRRLTAEEAAQIVARNSPLASYVYLSPNASFPREDAIRKVTIHHEIGGDWHVSERAFEALIDLCVDVCRRNGIEELRYTGDEGGTLTLHSMFSDETECPGPYLTGRMEEVAQAVNSRLKEG